MCWLGPTVCVCTRTQARPDGHIVRCCVSQMKPLATPAFRTSMEARGLSWKCVRTSADATVLQAGGHADLDVYVTVLNEESKLHEHQHTVRAASHCAASLLTVADLTRLLATVPPPSFVGKASPHTTRSASTRPSRRMPAGHKDGPSAGVTLLKEASQGIEVLSPRRRTCSLMVFCSLCGATTIPFSPKSTHSCLHGLQLESIRALTAWCNLQVWPHHVPLTRYQSHGGFRRENGGRTLRQDGADTCISVLPTRRVGRRVSGWMGVVPGESRWLTETPRCATKYWCQSWRLMCVRNVAGLGRRKL